MKVFLNFFILSGFLEYSSFYGSFVLKRHHLESFMEKVKENNLSVSILTRFYSKPCDFCCRKHDDNYFLLVETRRSENLIVLPFLDDYSLESTIKLKERFSSYYKNKFIKSLSNFN
jgi:hypothetical protein